MFARNMRHTDFRGAAVLVVGDLMLDRFHYGSVSRISPEAPVPVLLAKRELSMLGGAGNVVANIAALGGVSCLISVVGDDTAGGECKALLTATPRCKGELIIDPTRRTTTKTRFVSGSQQLLRCDEEDSHPFDESTTRQIVDAFDRVVGDYQVVALSDYAKGAVHDVVLRHIIDRCRELSIPVIVDPKRRDFSAYEGVTVIKPNRSELAAATSTQCATMEEWENAARHVSSITGAEILLTMSELGMVLYEKGKPAVHSHATTTEVFDVSGAGDTALAVFCSALAVRYTMEQAMFLANAAAGAVVRKLGTAVLSPEELNRELNRINEPLIEAVCDVTTAKGQVASWKQEGLSVGFTNGCFDIVHAGHIELLRRAAEKCDRLVVGLNSDASVSRLKGPQRPIQPAESRAAVLAAMQDVDMVVIFEEDTPLSLIQALRPTDLFKGADYTEDRVVGGDVVKADGGRVHLIELVPGLSTTRAVERIKFGVSDRVA
ncbi:D-glycero-beta-D-manno-heptose-7-phosphate kinase [Ensifer adhaerens]|uniref:D-glycero-beta-D-manno-heptose-7-phosphate kinase n=1 Tax=Ensifer adhaerens TaxID=106592 RepID=UPI00098EC6D8|nr:D-glycero-beta-D-manno-heptose-7-phosphate kinase [Ensifer adhaerens]